MIAVRVNPETKEDVERAAEQAGLSKAAFIRHKIKTEILQEGGQEA